MTTQLLSHPNKDEALDNQILRTLVGSGAHGLAIEGRDDRDEMGVFVERPERVFGVRRPLDSVVLRTVPEGARSGPGDTDLMLYSLRHWMSLAMAGNPSILVLLYTSDVLSSSDLGDQLRELAPVIVSRNAGPRFLGYLDGQRDRLTGGGKRNRVPNRPELIKEFGYDTKYASHALRLGRQGIELLTTGRLTLPMRDPDRALCLAVKKGAYSYDEAVVLIDETRRELAELVNGPDGFGVLREKPDRWLLAQWMREAHEEAWS